MQKFFISLLILIVLIAGYALYQQYTLLPDTEAIPSEDESAADTRAFSDEDVGLEFEYKTGEQEYVLETLRTVDAAGATDDEPIAAYQLVRHQDKVELENSDIPREGPPTIRVFVYKNTSNRSASQWTDAYPQASNITLATGEVDRDAVVGGANAVHYIADGLYMSENYVVAHGDSVYHFSGSYHQPESPIHTDFQALVDSVMFIPTSYQLESESSANIESFGLSPTAV